MKRSNKTFAWRIGRFAIAFGSSALVLASPARAEDLLSADTLSTLVEPLAVEIGDTTFTLRGAIDQAAHYNNDTEEWSARTTGDFEVAAETQTDNQLTIQLSYSGEYKSDPGSITDVGFSEGEENYTQEFKGSVGSAWGTLVGGNVNDTVANMTSRRQMTGNSALAFENNFGTLGDWVGGYSGRFGPAVIAVIADEDANVDAGFRWSRPLGDRDIGFGARATWGEFTSQDGTTSFDTTGIKLMTDMIYGSTLFDLGLGYEVLDSSKTDVTRAYVSGGVQHKTGALTLSLHGHYGVLDGNEEISASLGGRYDIARGLSANLGVNYARLNANVDGVELVNKDATETVLSMRYGF